VLTKNVSNLFEGGVRTRGANYFRRGNVEVLSLDPDGSVVAEVEGEDLYTIVLSLDTKKSPPRIKAFCDCPFVDSQRGMCKHIWATLLAVETKPPYSSLPRNTKVELDPTLSDVSAGEGHEDSPFPVVAAPSRAPTLNRLIEEFAKLGLDLPGPLSTLGRRTGLLPPLPPKPVEPPPWVRFLRDLATRPSIVEDHNGALRPSIKPLYILEFRDSSNRDSAVLSLAHRSVTATGKLGKIKPLSISASDFSRIQDPLDRQVCFMIVGAGAPWSNYGYYYSSSSVKGATWRVSKNVWGTLIPLLFETQRFYFRPPHHADPIPLTWDDGDPWEIILAVDSNGQAKSKAPHCVFSAQLRRQTERCQLSDFDCLLDADPAVWIRHGKMGRLQANHAFHWIDLFRSRGPMKVKDSERSMLLAELAKTGPLPPVSWPAAWRIDEIKDVPVQAELHLTLEDHIEFATRNHARGDIKFRYGDWVVDSSGAGIVVLDAKAGRQLVRNRTQEQQFVARAMELGMEPEPHGRNLRILERRLPALLTSLLDEGWQIFGNKTLFRKGGNYAVNISSGIDWFELEGGMDFEGQRVGMPELLAAARKGQRFVTLGDGSMGMLPADWLAKHGHFLELGKVEGERVRFTKTQIGLIDALLAELPEATFDAALSAARTRLKSFRGIEAGKAPPEFSGALRPYQEQGLGWLGFLNDFGWGGCLADDMGLGKTVQVLALLAERKRRKDTGPTLVVVPKSIVFNWSREAAQFTPQLNVIDYTGDDRPALRETLPQADLVITTYGILKRDIEHLREVEFNYVILDEAQAIKNPGSLNAKAVRLLKGRHRLVMTGTPVENRIGDLWSLFEFLNPGMVGGVNAFKNAFGRKSEDDNGRLGLLQRMLRPFILRRTKDQVATDLPKRTEQTIECAMPAKQAAYYNELRDFYRASLLKRVEKEGLAKSKIHVLEALLRLRQAACHPALVDESKRSVESAKLEALLPMITELMDEGHKALVFSQFTSMLAIVREELDSRGTVYEYLDGQTHDRQARVDRFQTDPDCRLFLISLKAGGVGLNLTAADYVFILDPWWNPAVEAQAIDRTHRIGQDKNVIAYRLIARDTVEAKILELQQSKRRLAEEIITEANSVIQSLTREDLTLLLS